MTNYQVLQLIQGLSSAQQIDLFPQENGIDKFELLFNENRESEGIDISKINNFELLLKDDFRLGRKVELLFQYFLDISNRYERILSNVQIFNEHRTIGELDFIIYDQERKLYIHLELAYKFYCYDETISEREYGRWIGPNRKDSLLEKRTKLEEKQFPLLYKKEARQLIEDNGIKVQLIKQEICFYAQLFIPINSFFSITDRNQYVGVNKDCIQGFWINYIAFVSRYRDQKFTYYIPSKINWLIDPSNNEKWIKFNKISEQLKEMYHNKRSSYLWIRRDSMNYDKCFIVWW